MEAVYLLYLAMAREMDPETGLGGRLLYIGEADAAGCRLLRAANIAGAASLAAGADAAALRRAMREGAIDFVVNSLDEALRILKNQIRKKQPVAVGVTLAPEIVLHEMEERGVQPDLLASKLPHSPEESPAIEAYLARGARRIALEPRPEEKRIGIDARLRASLAPADHTARRWVRFAPRYLPAAARRLRLAVDDASRRQAPGGR